MKFDIYILVFYSKLVLMDIINNLLSIKIKNRIKLIQKAIQNPIEQQEKTLQTHITTACNTVFGDEHGFKKITNYREYQNLIPVRDYEGFKKYIFRAQNKEKNILWPGHVTWFAKSSGTTQEKSKFIPITQDSLKMCHFKAGKDMLSMYLNNYPNARILNGKSLMIGGSTNINRIKSFYSGDLSAIIISNLPTWVQMKRAPSIKTALLDDWSEKIKQIIQETYQQNITSISGVPSWTIINLNELMQKHGINCLTECWPNLELYMHGGISFDNYKHTFTNYFKRKKINYLELYNASEGFFGIQNDPDTSDLLLLVNHGVFYEFIPIENGFEKPEQIISLKDVKLNVLYAMVISTNGGLWRYKIGDTIRFTSITPYKIKIHGRLKSFINAFGEELHVDNANQAIHYACKKTNSIAYEYIAAPFFYSDKSGCHEWIIEFTIPPNSIMKFNEILDKQLKALNSDYESKRFKNILLKPPKIHVARKNFFYEMLKKQNKIGGQNKIKRLYNDRKFIEELIENL